MHDNSPGQAVTVFCWVCSAALPSTSHKALADGMDHALDNHLDILTTDPDRVRDALTVSPPAPRPTWAPTPTTTTPVGE